MKKASTWPEYIILLATLLMGMISCKSEPKKDDTITMVAKENRLTAQEILGNPEFLAMSYGGYRHADHSIEPTLEELKEDMKILAAMGVKIIRTYKLHLPHAPNVLKAIRALKRENPQFEMYVMLGAWIDCKNAWTELEPDHSQESPRNAMEIDKAVELAKAYPEIVKVIAVGNEAMVKWATSYYVEPWVILKWVNHLQDLKRKRELPQELWITSSDNFASWGGGDPSYHVPDLDALIRAVDFISLHTYPMHDTHYNPEFWGVPPDEEKLEKRKKIDAAMYRALSYAQTQYTHVVDYMKGLEVDKPVHIGETGWASSSNGHYGPQGSKATDEYKEGVYYELMREWTNRDGISCFYFEGFDEPWKDAQNPGGSENHFGLINLKSEAKYALWDLVDKGVFQGLTRDGKPITKTFNGDFKSLITQVLEPPLNTELTGHR